MLERINNADAAVSVHVLHNDVLECSRLAHARLANDKRNRHQSAAHAIRISGRFRISAPESFADMGEVRP